ncbi:MAG TPA: Gfo/Idh/MocA family oxidoreductase [Thermoleophilia bacterium]|nr:Gfo/Idh/MocA family oxidoreductase [Thermoleophilia bacterium]
MPDGAVAPLGVALVGYGYWGPNLLRNYMELPGVTVRSVCDRRPEVLQKAQTRYPSVTVTVDLADVLADDDVDAVVIATPVRTHFPIAMAALEAGKHVFVEKPITDDSLHARRLVDLAADRSLVLMVGHTFVFSPPVRRVKELIDAGELGDIYFVTTQRVNLGLHQKDVSVIWDLAPHDLSILYYWLDETAESVTVMSRACIRADIPDVAFINLRFASGVVAEIQASWLSPVKLRRTIVVGSKKMLVYDDTESVEKVKIYDHGVDFKDPTDFGEFQLSYRTGDIVAPKIPGIEPLWLEAQHFIESVRTGDPPVTDGWAGLRVVASLEAAQDSLVRGGTQAIITPDLAALSEGAA